MPQGLVGKIREHCQSHAREDLLRMDQGAVYTTLHRHNSQGSQTCPYISCNHLKEKKINNIF